MKTEDGKTGRAGAALTQTGRAAKSARAARAAMARALQTVRTTLQDAERRGNSRRRVGQTGQAEPGETAEASRRREQARWEHMNPGHTHHGGE